MAEIFNGEKQRIIQEFVPGKQVTLAHIIANPNQDIYKKLGVIGEHLGAIGIMTITPSEAAIMENHSHCRNILHFSPFSHV